MSVIYNQGTNYTLYYNALNYFKTIMTNHPSITKVTTGDLFEVDMKEFPMYPIGNVNIFNTTIQESTTIFDVQLIVADKIKNKNNESNPITNAQSIPFFGVDDTVDILANTLAIINDLTSYTEYAVAAFDIDTDIVCEPFVDRFNNGLAGHVATFKLVTHNDRNRCLFFLINPSGSGYQIQNCATQETYYAVINGQVNTGSVFSSTYPTNYSCYNVLESVTDFNDWDLVNLPVINDFASCEICAQCETIDIVRDGLIMAFDWTSYNGDGTLTDKSGNGYNANYFGNLTLNNNALQFDGTSSYIALDIDANQMYQSWKWTVDTYGIINDVDNTTQYGNIIAINNTGGGSDVPEWSFVLQTSGSSTPDLSTWNALVNTKDAPITASLILPHQFTYIGRQSASANRSEVTLSMDTNPLSGSGQGVNIIPGRAFNGNGGFPGAASSSSLQYFGGPQTTYVSPFGPITWNALSGSIEYILYYNRDLTQAEIQQNNTFYLCNKTITPGTTTTTSTTSTTSTTTLAPTTTTTTLEPTTTTTTSTTSTTSTTTTIPPFSYITASVTGATTTGTFVSGGFEWRYYDFYSSSTYTPSFNVIGGYDTSAKLLIIGAGGSGGADNNSGGGGGAGQVIYVNNFTLLSGSSYTLTVPGYAAGVTTTQGINGSAAVGFGYTANGGGGGGAVFPNGEGRSVTGGSGGGGSEGELGGTGTFSGGNSSAGASGGGGGGASSNGNNTGFNGTSTPGDGGTGLSFTITGTTISVAGGGGGGTGNNHPAAQGPDGGGTGATFDTNSTNGELGTGAGGGGGMGPFDTATGEGGSGRIIIAYKIPPATTTTTSTTSTTSTTTIAPTTTTTAAPTTTTTTAAATTTTTAGTTTTTTISYDYYSADEYTCTGCTLTGPTPVKFPAGTVVTIGKFYRTNPNTAYSYLVTATSTPGGALTMDTIPYNSCALACT